MSEDTKSKFTLVRIKREILELARQQAELHDRSVPNYIAWLIKKDARESK